MNSDRVQKVTAHVLPALPYAENALESVISARSKKIEADFGSLDTCKKELATAAATQFGSGWAWLVLDTLINWNFAADKLG